MTLQLLVEDIVDRCALENGGEDAGHGIAADDGNAGVAGDSEPALGEDTEVEEENAKFCEVDGELVEDLVKVKHLKSASVCS